LKKGVEIPINIVVIIAILLMLMLLFALWSFKNFNLFDFFVSNSTKNVISNASGGSFT